MILALARRPGQHCDNGIFGTDTGVDRVASCGSVACGNQVGFGRFEVLNRLLEEALCVVALLRV